MIKSKMVPEVAADAAKELGVSRWVARDIVAAVLNAWPEAYVDNDPYDGRALILPLTENPDDNG